LAHPIARHWPEELMSITCITAWAVALLLLPLLVLLWATESREQRARRWRRQGLTQQAIADRLGCSRTTVRRLLAA
jgi:AraC-like DNA-binding protein